MFRNLITLLIVFSLSLTTVACGGGNNNVAQPNRNQAPVATSTNTKIADGKYPVQQGSFNDSNGEYSLFLLNSSPSLVRTTDLQMARLTEEEEKAGEKSYLKVENGQKSLHLTEDFKIEYVHAVTETQTNPQTGQPQTVIVRQESSFWTPFAGALAGQMIGSMLFTPHYYMPPVYQPGVMTGYGGYGRTYNQAVQSYQTRYQAPPIVERNRTQFRSTGRINSPSSTTANPSRPSSTGKPTGSGFGTSTLKQSGQGSSSNQKSSPRFGSGSGSSGAGSRRPARSRRR
ncbi:hypothetical protein NG798_06935 [Ancylothrix sp. C2]|uniref:hypothetical protein n=1 Tax=Ancylothrix sp. D3o TaxID=2953691 RepID=UPI0021BAEB8B|nr:hypothetical protein [Ancylothrix sp. D3o]MCT7949515.1 hypothetical protein [Ancylothrix sp. D3o]